MLFLPIATQSIGPLVGQIAAHYIKLATVQRPGSDL